MKQIQTTLPNFQVYVDGELQEPSKLERSVTHVEQSISRFKAHVVLQARIVTFDVLHGTNYRQIRNQLIKQKRQEEFEKMIGLVKVK